MTIQKIKQALMIIGGLTVAGVVTMAGVVAYLWFDTQNVEIEEDFDEIEEDFEEIDEEFEVETED